MPKKLDFETQVLRALRKPTKTGKGWQSTTEIAAKLGLVNDDGEVKPSGAAKVRRYCNSLVEAGKAQHTGAFRTSRYAKA